MLDDALYLEHQLVRDLGGMTLTWMRENMPLSEFMEHAAFYKRRHAEQTVRR